MTLPTDPRKRFALGVGAVLVAAVVGAVAVETWRYVQDHVATALAPILAAALGVALFALLVSFLWHVLRDPTRRLAERTRDEIDYRIERSRAVRELERRLAAFEEEQRVRAMTASARVHEDASRALSDGRLRQELDELRGRSEDVVMRAQSVSLARLLARYEAAYLRLDQAENMTAAEKAQLIEEMRALLAEEAPSAATGR